MSLFAKYFLTKGSIFWSILALVCVKFVFSSPVFQFAAVLDSIPLFDSREIISETNEARKNNNIVELKPNYQLDLAAQEKLEDMVKNNYFSHVSPSGTTPWFWIKSSAYNYLYAGENLAIGFTTADETVEAWLNSPSHKENLLNTNYREIGVAVGRANVDGVSGILVVQMFGAQSAQAAFTRTQGTQTLPSSTPVIPESKSEAGAKIELNKIEKEPAVTLQYISTDSKVAPVQNPKVVEHEDGHVINSISSMLNNIYLVYALIASIMSIIAVVLFDRNLGGFLKASAHVAILVIATFLPTLSSTIKGLIF